MRIIPFSMALCAAVAMYEAFVTAQAFVQAAHLFH